MRRGKERQTLLAMLLLLALAILGDARSPPTPPLKRLHTPASSSLEILPRQHSHLSTRSYIQPHPSTLLHSDTVFLTINLPSLLPFPAHLLLHPTEHLFHPEARITYQSGVSEPLRAEDYRLYSGLVVHPRWAERMKWEEMSGLHDPRSEALSAIGRASIMVHEHGEGNPTYEGSFTLDGVTHHILTKAHYDKVRTADDVEAELGDMVVFRDQDMHHGNTTTGCSHDLQEPNLFKRDDIAGGMSGGTNYINSIGNPAGCPSEQRLLYMGVALDCNYVSTYGSPADARTQVLNNWNQASALYKSTFNVSLGIVELQVQNQTCGTSAPSDAQFDVSCDAQLTMDQRLSLFSQWRGDRSNDGIGLWHLMSACPTDTEVGVAWLGTLCQTSSNQQSGSFVSGTGMSTASKTEWSLISHEIGHGFGAIHDCTDGCSLSGPCCPLSSSSCDAGGTFIMNPTTSASEQTFSQCTLGNICSGLGSNTVSSSCLATPGQGQRQVISLQQCGNGIVDPGEDCDPGVGANSTCCDASTCRFRSGAVCDPSNSACCTSSCQYSSAGTICRPAVNPTCDFAEECSGSSADCPSDRTADDGRSCGNGLSCAAGQCTSLDQQCRNAGTSMGLTTACGQRNDRSCVISCRDPTTANQCIVLQTPLLDGSPCGYGGHCYNQTCQSGSWQDTAGSWYRSNLQISIPVTIVAGLLVLAILIFLIRCIYRGCCGRRPRPRQSILPPPQRSSMRQSVYNPVTPVRNPDSVSSQDPIASTAVRDPSPNGEYSNGYGSVPQTTPPRQPDFSTPPSQYYTPQNRRQSELYSSPAPPPPPGFPDPASYGGHNPYGQGYGSPQYSGQSAWVDASAYNGPHYGPNEAYGR